MDITRVKKPDSMDESTFEIIKSVYIMGYRAAAADSVDPGLDLLALSFGTHDAGVNYESFQLLIMNLAERGAQIVRN